MRKSLEKIMSEAATLRSLVVYSRQSLRRSLEPKGPELRVLVLAGFLNVSKKASARVLLRGLEF